MDTIQPVEDFVFEGLSKKIQQVFNCICIITTANDKTKVLARVLEGKKVEYPYIFIVPQSLGANTESYNANFLGRRGLITTIDGDVARTVRIMPANFDVELEFVTNKYQSLEQGSMLAFARRWLFARRFGYLKFNVRYGRLNLAIAPTLADVVTLPQLDNKVEAEASYKATTTLTVHGYISEPELGTQGIIEELKVQTFLNADGSTPPTQFISF